MFSIQVMKILAKMSTSYRMSFSTITVSLQDSVLTSIMMMIHFRTMKTLMYIMLLKKLKIWLIIWMIDLSTISQTIFLFFLVATSLIWMLITISISWTIWSIIWTSIIQTNTSSNIQLQVIILMPYKNMMSNGPLNMMT